MPGSLSVHLDGEPERRPVYEHAVASGALAPGYAADDGAAVVFHGTRLSECIASRPSARVLRVAADGDGGCVETEQPVRVLPGAVDGSAAEPEYESRGVSELRALRAGRHRWD